MCRKYYVKVCKGPWHDTYVSPSSFESRLRGFLGLLDFAITFGEGDDFGLVVEGRLLVG